VSVALRPQSFVGPSYAVATPGHHPANTRFVKSRFGVRLEDHGGSPRNTAASIIGRPRIPRLPSRRRQTCGGAGSRRSPTSAGASFATFGQISSANTLEPGKRIVSSGNPASGTRRAINSA